MNIKLSFFKKNVNMKCELALDMVDSHLIFSFMFQYVYKKRIY